MKLCTISDYKGICGSCDGTHEWVDKNGEDLSELGRKERYFEYGSSWLVPDPNSPNIEE